MCMWRMKLKRVSVCECVCVLLFEERGSSRWARELFVLNKQNRLSVLYTTVQVRCPVQLSSGSLVAHFVSLLT